MRFTLIIFCILVLIHPIFLHAQRKCGIEELKKSLIKSYPDFEQQWNDYKEELNSVLKDSKKELHPAKRNTNDITIPVIFHIVINKSQLDEIGGKAGIKQRCDSQIAVLNRDFNAANYDTNMVPENWKPLIGNAGIHFGLAHTNPSGYASLGYELRIVGKDGFFGLGDSYDSAKHFLFGGVDAWDNTKYLNVWCVNFTDYPGLLGITVPNSFVKTKSMPVEDKGVCILYNSLGKRVLPSDSYPINATSKNYFDLGRTLTHEIGHFFEIWHVWGDDGGLCPWTGGNTVLPDLPAQGNSTNGNPIYSIPGGTIYDNCMDSDFVNVQPIGIACLDYLDYTDDKGMHLFTPDQATVMASQVNNVNGESYSLTLHPELLCYPANAKQVINLFPNPTGDEINISYEIQADTLKQVVVYDVIGRERYRFNCDPSAPYLNIKLRPLNDGLYILKLYFTKESITQNIILQSVHQ